MGDVNTEDIQQQLSQAPPNAVTVQDVEANKASASANALSAAASSALTPPVSGVDKIDLNPNRPGQSGFEAPASVPSPAPGSVGWHLANALSTPAAQKPGGKTTALLGAVTDALLHGNSDEAWKTAQSDAGNSRPTQAPRTAPKPGFGANIMNALRDARAGNSNPGGALGAKSDRERQEMQDNITMAKANAEMLHEQYLVHQLGEEAIDNSIKSGTQAVENMTSPPPGGEAGKVDVEGKTSDELTQMIKNKEIDPSVQTVFATGKKLTGKDANGIPQYRTTYSVVTPPKSMDVSPENAKLINKYLGMDLPTDGKLQNLPGVQVNALLQKAYTAQANARALQVKNAKDQEAIDKAQTSADAKAIFNNPTVSKVISAVTKPGADGSADPFTAVKTYNYFMSHPDLIKQTGIANFAESMIQAAGGQATFDKLVSEYNSAVTKNKDTVDEMLAKAENDPKEIEGHTPAFTAAMNSIIADPTASPDRKKRAAGVLATVKDVRQGEIDLEKAKAEGKKTASEEYQGNPAATTPEEFLASLKPNEQSLVKEMGQGKMPLTRLEYLASRKPELLEAVAKAFPDFDGSKVQGYVQAYKDFTSGKTAVQLESGGTALKHLKEAKELNTVASHIPGTPAYNAYENKIDTLATELAKFYGDATVPAIAAIKKTLTATLPGNRDAAISTQAKSMGDKLDSLEQKWTNAAPSKAYQAPMPYIDTAAQQARAALDPTYAAAHPNLVPKLATNAPAGAIQRPADLPTATHTQQFTKGGVTKTFWTDAAGKPLREATDLPKEP